MRVIMNILMCVCVLLIPAEKEKRDTVRTHVRCVLFIFSLLTNWCYYKTYMVVAPFYVIEKVSTEKSNKNTLKQYIQT